MSVKESFETNTYQLHLAQETPPTPGQDVKAPACIPIAIGLLDSNGTEVRPTQLLELKESAQTFSFEGFDSKPIPSILRGFSAPVILTHDQSDEERALLFAYDTDPFNRWDAGRRLAQDMLVGMTLEGAAPRTDYLDGVAATLRDGTLDPAFRALVLRLPTEEDTAQAIADGGNTPDPMAINTAHETLKLHVAQHLQDMLPRIYAEMDVPGPYKPDAASSGKRALGNAVLSLISKLDGGKQATAQIAAADNMTQQLGALRALLQIDKGAEALLTFETQWQHDRLVMDKWFALQVSLATPQNAAATAVRLTAHPAFDIKNPNRFRSVFGGLKTNTAGFHHPSGEAYDLMADWLIKLDPINPQTTARMMASFDTWRRYDGKRQKQMKTALQRIANTAGLSRDTTEMVQRILG